MKATGYMSKLTIYCLLVLLCAACAGTTTTRPEETLGSTPTITPSPSLSPKPTATVTPSVTPAPTATPTAAIICSQGFFAPIAFLPNNTRLLGWSDKGISDIDLGTGREEVLLELTGSVVTAAVSPDGQLLATALDDHSLRLMRLSDKKVLRSWTGHTDMITALKFSPRGDLLFSASHDTWVRVWDLAEKQIKAFQPGGAEDQFPSEVVGLGISPDGNQVGTISVEGPMKLWDLATLQKIAQFEGSIDGGYDGSDVAFSADGQYLAAGLGGGGLISLWKLSDGSLLWRGGTFALAFSPDGRIFAYADRDEAGNDMVTMRSADGKTVIRELKGHTAVIWKIIFSPDGKLLASVDDAQIRVWQVEDGRLQLIRNINCP